MSKEQVITDFINTGKLTAEMSEEGPMVFAIMHDSSRIVEHLIAQGYNVNNELIVTMSLLVDWREKYTPLCFAANQNKYEICKILLTKGGADINMPGSYSGSIPLHDAAEFGDARLVELFLEKKADPNIANGRGKALSRAQTGLKLENIKALLKAGAVDPEVFKNALFQTYTISSGAEGGTSYENASIISLNVLKLLLLNNASDINYGEVCGMQRAFA